MLSIQGKNDMDGQDIQDFPLSCSSCISMFNFFAPHTGESGLNLFLKAGNQFAVGGDQRLLGFDLGDDGALRGDGREGDFDLHQSIPVELRLTATSHERVGLAPIQITLGKDPVVARKDSLFRKAKSNQERSKNCWIYLLEDHGLSEGRAGASP